MDLATLDKTLREVFNNREEPRKLVIRTGFLGMIIFEYALMDISLHCKMKYFVTSEKRCTQFSFIEKHGMYKARLNRKLLKLDLFHGTNFLLRTDNLQDIEKYINGK